MALTECELELQSNVPHGDQRSGKQPEDTYFTTRNQASSPGGRVSLPKRAPWRLVSYNECMYTIPITIPESAEKRTSKPPDPINPSPNHLAPKIPSRAMRLRVQIRHVGTQLLPSSIPVRQRIDPRRRAAVHAHALRHVGLRLAEVRPAGTYAEDVAAVLGLREEAGGWPFCHRSRYRDREDPGG